MNRELYATLQIAKNEIIFVVGKYSTSQLMVIYKNKIKGDWLNQDGTILNERSALLNVKKFISEAENRFKISIKNIILVLPSNTLTSNCADNFIRIENPKGIVLNQDIQTLYSTAQTLNFNDKRTIINIRPLNWVVNDQKEFQDAPINYPAKILKAKMMLYTIDKIVHDSHMSILKELNKSILYKVLDNYALLDQVCTANDYTSPIAVVNWNENNTYIGFYVRRSLITFKSLNFGSNELINKIKNRLGIKSEIAKKYLFKLLDFNNDKYDSNLAFRKFDIKKNLTSHYTTKDIKIILEEEIASQITKIDYLIESEFKGKISNYKIKYVGKMNEIAGVSALISKYSNQKNNFELYFSKILGASEIWTTVSTGAIKYSKLQNTNLNILKTSETDFSVHSRNSQSQQRMTEQQKQYRPNMQTPMRHYQQAYVSKK